MENLNITKKSQGKEATAQRNKQIHDEYYRLREKYSYNEATKCLADFLGMAPSSVISVISRIHKQKGAVNE